MVPSKFRTLFLDPLLERSVTNRCSVGIWCCRNSRLDAQKKRCAYTTNGIHYHDGPGIFCCKACERRDNCEGPK